MVECLAHAADRRDRHPAAQPAQPLLRGAGRESFREDREERVAVPITRGEGREAGVRRQLGRLEGVSEGDEELLLGARDRDIAVGGGEELEGHDGGMGGERPPLRVHPRGEVPRRSIPEHRKGRNARGHNFRAL